MKVRLLFLQQTKNILRRNYSSTPFSLQSLNFGVVRKFSILNMDVSNHKPVLPSRLLNEDGLRFREKLYEDITQVEKELVVDSDQRDAFFRLVMR
jgi:hypothetical protein